MKLFHICKYLSLSRTEMEIGTTIEMEIGTTIYTQYRIPVNKKWGYEEEEDARINEAPARETGCF
ncbi:hypothetical protein HanPSC8_Chr06g0256271 [Helianthus annuus]|nr:hypothetical protein HanIR_Chr06g0285711 [Helianthus annuus]KAJ0915982.1 hypothetical protein HanPSC8_Chr06g0256271 [Helianthus annuus]